MLRVGLVGAGMIATAHASAYENLQDQVQVVAVADVMPERAKAMGQRFNAEVFPDGETLIEQAEVDVIDVCTPTFLHAKHTIQACRAKRHVLCEKPMALSLAEADAMIQAAEDNGVTLMIAQVLRFWP
jgi:UDP-N-acetylglucosamine 3-dehydrogenase